MAFRSTNASSPATMDAPSTTAPTSVGKSDATTGGTFTHAPSGITLSWPEGWKQQPSDDYVWAIVPANSMAGSERWISLDVPDLPWHPPGMIPIGSVESGYLDDLRGKFGKIETKELTPPPISDAKLRMVSVGWQQDGKSMREAALLIVHNDHVYILRRTVWQTMSRQPEKPLTRLSRRNDREEMDADEEVTDAHDSHLRIPLATCMRRRL